MMRETDIGESSGLTDIVKRCPFCAAQFELYTKGFGIEAKAVHPGMNGSCILAGQIFSEYQFGLLNMRKAAPERVDLQG